MSGLEDTFGPTIYGEDVARLKPARHFVEIGEPVIEPTRLHERKPLTEEEAEEILKDWASREEQGRPEDFCGL